MEEPLKTVSGFLREVASAIRKVWPERLPLFNAAFRDRLALEKGGWEPDHSVALAKILQSRRGGPESIVLPEETHLKRRIPSDPGTRRRRLPTQHPPEAGLPHGAVGMITVRRRRRTRSSGQVRRTVGFDAREHLRAPYFSLRAAGELTAHTPATPFSTAGRSERTTHRSEGPRPALHFKRRHPGESRGPEHCSGTAFALR